jgi:hypothetical protein
MAAPSSQSLSNLFTQLMGRQVTFVQTNDPSSEAKQIYGVYATPPDETATVVKADLSLLGSFAGALVGLPDAAVKEHLRSTQRSAQIEEPLRDAIHEVLNVASAVIAIQGRTVLTAMETDPARIEGAAANVLKKPVRKQYFNVSISGYQGGKFAILC